MAKAIRQSRDNTLLYPITSVLTGNKVKQSVYDGDTVNVSLDGDFGVRFLGIDTAEMSFTLPGNQDPISIKDPAWKTFLTNPFASQYGDFSRIELDGITKVQGNAETILSGELVNYLRNKLGPQCAANHSFHADKAHRWLEQLIKNDVDERNRQQRQYRFFLAFSYTMADRYGRLLAFVRRHVRKDENLPIMNGCLRMATPLLTSFGPMSILFKPNQIGVLLYRVPISY